MGKRLGLSHCPSRLAPTPPARPPAPPQACKRLPLGSLVGVLRSGCPSLAELDVQYYAGVDGAVVPALRAACPSLQSVLVTAPQHRHAC